MFTAAAADKTILDCVRVAVNPPMALGLGKAHLDDKIAALMFAWFLECPSMSSLNQTAQHCISFAADMGTEMGLASFMATDVDKLFPAWMATSSKDFECDGGMADGAGGSAPVNVNAA